MDKSSRRLEDDKPSVAKEMHKGDQSVDIPTDESVTDGSLHSRSETLLGNLADSENKAQKGDHRYIACGSCKSSNDVDK